MPKDETTPETIYSPIQDPREELKYLESMMYALDRDNPKLWETLHKTREALIKRIHHSQNSGQTTTSEVSSTTNHSPCTKQ